MSESRIPMELLGNPADIVGRTTSRLDGWLSTRRAVAIQVVGFYVAAGVGWILVAHWASTGTSEKFLDFLFVLISAILLFFLIDRGLATVRHKEAKLRECWERTTRILEANPCGVVLVDRAGRIEYANPESAKILGIDRSDLTGSSYFELRTEVTKADGMPCPREERPAYRALRNGEANYGVELGVRRPDGASVILSVNSEPIRDAAGAVDGMVVSFYDITDRKRAQDLDLRKLSLAIAQSPIAIMITDADCMVEYVNPSYSRMTGYTAEDVIGTRAVPFRASAVRRFSRAASPEEARDEWREEFEGRRKSGEPYWESMSVSPVRDANGTVTHLLWIREDITVRRLGEEALREGREKFQALVENVDDLVWGFDRNLVFTYVSPKVRDLLGCDPEDVVGRTPFDFMPASEAKRVREILAPLVAKRRRFRRLECVVHHSAGGMVIVEVSGTPIVDSDGTFRGWRGVCRDVTARRRSEDLLRAKEEHFRQMFEQSEDPTIVFEPGSARIRDANPAAVGLFGHSKDELAEGGLALLADPETARDLEARIGAVDDGTKLVLDAVAHVRKGGERIVVSIRGKSIRLLGGGRFTHCTFRDITDRIRMESEARSRQAQLIHANRMASLGTIVTGVAHEINNPNNLVMFNAPMVAAAWRDAARHLDARREICGDFALGGLPFSEMRDIVPRLIAGMSDASQRIKAIVENLKGFSRRDAPDRRASFDVVDAVRRAVAILNHEILKGCYDFRVETCGLRPRVTGSPEQLEQVIVNLVMNALQSLPDKSRRIRVSTAAAPGEGTVEIRVDDEGRGMPPDVVARLAEPFFTTRAGEGGLGLGLSISKSIVEAHGGTLAFRSEVGRGTTAIVTLPAADEKMPRAAASAAPGGSG